ncbi:hypothetical protein CABS01_11095 [Colletotrichum abscissum]|nr:uncharacterized protein CABS01_11095 [Colletotrichum abscissum]KAK1496946.1 hypothetical protein CABS01_11095 [Colletotrichum abscissum]
MDRAASRPFPRRPVQWNRPMTRRNPEISRIDLHTKDQRRFEDEGTNPSLLSTFLNIPDYSPRLEYELPVFQNVLDETILRRICEGNFEMPSNLAAWLHDRDLSNKPRSYNGSLSLLDFDRHLDSQPIGKKDISNADTRKICINNPCQWTLGVLAVRAPDHQAPVIRDFMFKHLTAKTSIGLDTVVRPFPRIHKTYLFVLLTAINRLTVASLWSSTWLTPSGKGNPLHEEISVLLGTVYLYATIGLMDSYFEDDSDPNNEYLLPFYVADPYPDPDMTSCELDALSIANLTADNVSVTDPREYFLLVVKFHVARITQHWMNVLFKLKDMIDEYLSSPHIPLTRRESSLGTMRGESYAIEASEAWLGQTSDLVIQWILLLTKTIKAWNKFFDQDASRIVCQSSEDGLNHMNDSLYEISRSLDELMAIREEMEELKVKVERFEKKLGLHVAVGDNRAIVLQYWNVTILQFISPFAVAGTIMQAGLVFGHPVLCFTVLASAVAFIMWALKPTLTWLARKARLEEANNIVPQQIIQGLQLENGVQTTSYSLPTRPTMAYHRFQGVSIDKSSQVM